MLGYILAILGALFFISTGAFLAFDRSKQDVVLSRIGIRRRRATGSFTPPRSLSPEKQGLPPNKLPFTPDYSDAFPPSRREALAALPPDALHGSGASPQELAKLPPDYTKRVPNEKVCNTDDLNDHVTATGFTVEEIKRLGDFPDYATLSGVPLPQVCQNFNLETARPRPYRPIRWAYHQTMSITKLEADYWLELESTYTSRINQRIALFEKYGPMVLQALPGSEIACKELMEMSLQFICARYPSLFQISADKTTFHNHVLNNSTDLKATEPLHVLLRNVPEDFAMVLRDPATGVYNFRAGVICSSLGWNVGSKIGMNMDEIHVRIPDYKEKMQFSMNRYFSKKPTDKAIQRGSWGLEIDEPLFMPPGDPHEALRDTQNPEHTIDRCHLRVDWQTLRRLPLSGAVVFNFKALFTPVSEFRTEPYVPSLLLKVLKEGKKELMEYKGTWHTEHIVIPAMEEFEKEQKEKGIMEKDWEPHTLDESPFFPGWEEKWRRSQGF